MRPPNPILMILLFCFAAPLPATPLNYDELVDGPLPGLSGATELGPLDLGINIVSGSVDATDPCCTFDLRFDGFHVFVPLGAQIAAVEIIISDFVGAGPAIVFLGSASLPGSTGASPTSNGIFSVYPKAPFSDPIVELARVNLQVGTASVSGESLSYQWRINVQAAIAEPTTLALMGLGLAGLGFVRRRLH